MSLSSLLLTPIFGTHNNDFSFPKPHAFANLPLQSATPGTGGGTGGGTGSGSGLPGSNSIPTCNHKDKHSFTFKKKEDGASYCGEHSWDPHKLISPGYHVYYKCKVCGKKICHNCYYKLLCIIPFTTFSIIPYLPLVSIILLLVHLLTLLNVDLSIFNCLKINLDITGYYYVDQFVTIVLPWIVYFNEKKKLARLVIYLHSILKKGVKYNPVLVTYTATFIASVILVYFLGINGIYYDAPRA
jgi:hypothetical protein